MEYETKHMIEKEKVFYENKKEMLEKDGKLRVIVIGGSIAGLCCAHALLRSGVCRVMVLERARALSGDAEDGLTIDKFSCEAFEVWGLRDTLFRMSKTLDKEENRAVDTKTKVFTTLSRDEEFRHRAIHWSDLHRVLYDSLPSGIAHFGHEVISLQENKDRSSFRVSVAVKKEEGDCEVTKEVHGDIIVAADGRMSRTRQLYFPNETRRYAGYCVWRGVLDCNHNSKVYEDVKIAYPEIGETMYSELARGSHAVIFELKGRRLNWLWYVNEPESAVQGYSETRQPDSATVAAMHDAADRTWMPALAQVIKLTAKPVISAIYDNDPLKQLAWRRVVLVGEAAHPTCPHANRATNMSIEDGHALGKAFEKWGPRNINFALAEYESKRLPAIAQQVLFSRHIGKFKQGMLFEAEGSFPWLSADDGLVEGLLLRNMGHFPWRK